MNNCIKKNDYCQFEIDFEWAKLPTDWNFHEVADVAVDSNDNVYIFNRGEHPVIVIDNDGHFLSAWGKNVFSRPHGLTIGPNDTLYCVDDGDHSVRVCSLDGTVLLTIGDPGNPAPFLEGKPFNRPTKVALEPYTGSFYVADGYGNARIHKYTSEGKLLFSWGKFGTGPGEFNLVHSICTDNKGRVYVADRENHRIQIFDNKGTYLTQWNNMHRPCGLHITKGEEQLVLVGELPTSLSINSKYPNIGACITIYNLEGERLTRLGDQYCGEDKPNQFIAPHGIASNSRGDIYIGEVPYSFYGKFMAAPHIIRNFRKLIKIS